MNNSIPKTLDDSQVLSKCFKIAAKNGYAGDIPIYDDRMGWYVSDGDGGYVVPSITEILLSHDFAKALFGEDDEWSSTKCTCNGFIHPLMDMHIPECAKMKSNRGWQYHGQQLFLATYRIDYLRKWLGEDIQ